jgi:hypothetical protein
MNTKLATFILNNQESLSKEQILELMSFGVLEENTPNDYTATEIGEELGISKRLVGEISNEHNVKIEKYGQWLWDVCKDGRKRKNFRYNEMGKNRIIELYYQYCAN